jgi:hypothetical protein
VKEVLVGIPDVTHCLTQAAFLPKMLKEREREAREREINDEKD